MFMGGKANPFLAVLLICCMQVAGQGNADPAKYEGSVFQPPAGGNLLRNGSFEGSLKYWHRGLDSTIELVKSRAVGGRSQCSMRFSDQRITWSAPFLLEPGSTVTVSGDLRSEQGDGLFHFYLAPTCRSAGKEPFRPFWGNSGKEAAVTWKDWKRVSWVIAIPDEKVLDYRTWWDGRTWTLMLMAKSVHVDDLAVILGGDQKDFRPFSSIEVTEMPTNLPAWKSTCRILEKGFGAELETAVFNPSASARDITVRWQLLDFTGSRILQEIGRSDLSLKSHATGLLRHRVALNANGLVLSRATVLDPNGSVLGRSDAPLTTLPFPKSAAQPNWRERFGGTVAAGNPNPYPTQLLPAAQHIGFAWSRWYPHMNWERVQPNGPDAWDWPDELVDAVLASGISINAVLYAKPKWAFDDTRSRHLPRDMADWSGDDSRWEDLTVTTSWDRYVTEVVKHYRGKSVAWEVVNEPYWAEWDPRIYTRLIKRTYRLVKAANPDAVVMVNGVYGIDSLHQKFLDLGGVKFCDVFTFHNYSPGEFSSGDQVAGLRQALDLCGGTNVALWFNEGWTHFPSSEDYPANTLFADRGPAQVVHGAVRTIADTFAGGLDKFIMFQLGYDHQGRSWWDWDGDGTSFYDDCHQPTAVVPTFNVLCEHLGLSRHVATVHAEDATFHFFEDGRNHRGVAVAWAEKEGARFELPLDGLVQMDVMGNAMDLTPNGMTTTLTFGDEGVPVYLFSRNGVSGEKLAMSLRPFERPNVLIRKGVYSLPTDWISKGPEGNPYIFQGKPIWWLGRVYPPEPGLVANFRCFPNWVPAQTRWTEFANSQGGNPAAGLAGGLKISVITEWMAGDQAKPSALVFVAPEASSYRIEAEVFSERWAGTGNGWLELYVLDRATGKTTRLAHYDLPDRQTMSISEPASLAAGQELAFVYGADRWNTGASCAFRKIEVVAAGSNR